MSSPFPSCFRPSQTTDDNHYFSPPPPPSPPSTNPNITTYLYHTDIGLVSLTWSRSILGRSLHVNLHNHPFDSPSLPSLSSFHLHIKPFIFWKKHGTKKLSSNTNLFWNLSKAKFGSGPEPNSGFYVAIVVDKEMTLLIGDSKKDAYAKSKALAPKNSQFLVLKREHVFANKVYNTRARFGGRMREIQIDCGGDSSKLCFSVDGEKVLQIKRLKWKFRGNERVEIEGVPVQISWDVYNWLFEKDNSDGHAIFMFKFEEEDEEERRDKSLMNVWTHQNLNLGSYECGKFGSTSSVSMTSSTGSFGGSSSVLEWSSVEENELVIPIGFSLLVYAWKR
ncbi:hypothetical protein TanjilG_07857 [Lupinus angustifolius]|uniref:DUF868 domain-containing protein n=1 Tax=Lupinus angustifolius TaxID=3871 RepID=A0A1J7GQ81_LUPAN|nr:PREDICTED: uncharacterized protein LOC109328585 [Lupinus angustifolius]OIV96465.1 hypothetical protein TanjilG_07857 [Lupinus angustifolius]